MAHRITRIDGNLMCTACGRTENFAINCDHPATIDPIEVAKFELEKTNAFYGKTSNFTSFLFNFNSIFFVLAKVSAMVSFAMMVGFFTLVLGFFTMVYFGYDNLARIFSEGVAQLSEIAVKCSEGGFFRVFGDMWRGTKLLTW